MKEENFDLHGFASTTSKETVEVDVPAAVDQNELQLYIPDDVQTIFENVLK